MQIVSLRNDINDLLEKVRQQDEEKLNSEHEIQSLKDMLTNKKLESDKEQTRKKHMEKELKDLKAVLESRQSEIKSKQQQIAQGQERIQRLELQLKEQKVCRNLLHKACWLTVLQALTEKALKDYELLNQRTLKLSQDLEDQVPTHNITNPWRLPLLDQHEYATPCGKLTTTDGAEVEGRANCGVRKQRTESHSHERPAFTKVRPSVSPNYILKFPKG